MDASEFLGLRATHNPVRWYLDVVPGICTDDQFLFGGCGLGAAIAALERTTGRPAVWAVAQYLSFAHPPEIVDIDVTVASACCTRSRRGAGAATTSPAGRHCRTSSPTRTSP